jgi:hypothetical protein
MALSNALLKYTLPMWPDVHLGAALLFAITWLGLVSDLSYEKLKRNALCRLGIMKWKVFK